LKYGPTSASITIRVYSMLPIETRDMYLRADMDFAKERGKIRKRVVTTAWTTLKMVMP
jgi:hypothetical protein